MTGFGRCEIQKEARKFTVELKSVNHRYLDVNIRMPKKLNFFETSIRTLLKSYANRGKVPTPKIRVKGHLIILEARNTYAPSVSKAKNRRHYHRVVGNNYNSLYN